MSSEPIERLASLATFEAPAKQLIHLALDHDVSKSALMEFISDLFNEARNNRRSRQ